MVPAEINYKDHVRGDTINERKFTISQTIGDNTSPVDLSGAVIRVDFVADSRIKKTIGNGITVIDPPNGIFKIDNFKLDIPGRWRYDVEIEFPDGLVKTWIKGFINIKDDITK